MAILYFDMTGSCEQGVEVPERFESVVSFSVEVEYSLRSDSEPDGVGFLLPHLFLLRLDPATLAAGVPSSLGHSARECV